MVLSIMEARNKGTAGDGKSSSSVGFIILGVAALFLIWQVLSMTLPDIIIASPAGTARALWDLVTTANLWEQLGITLSRILLGVIGGSVAGGLLGIAAGLNRRWQAFLEPLRWVVMTVPSIIILVIVLLLFGLGSTQVIAMTGLITLPFTYVSTVEGMQAIDRRLIEMAQVYRLPRNLRFSHIYLPGIGTAVMAGLTLAAGIGVRAAILAEFLGANNGIGHGIYLSWTHLETPELFAWIILTFGLLALIEFGLLRPLRRILLRWQRAT